MENGCVRRNARAPRASCHVPPRHLGCAHAHTPLRWPRARRGARTSQAGVLALHPAQTTHAPKQTAPRRAPRRTQRARTPKGSDARHARACGCARGLASGGPTDGHAAIASVLEMLADALRKPELALDSLAAKTCRCGIPCRMGCRAAREVLQSALGTRGERTLYTPVDGTGSAGAVHACMHAQYSRSGCARGVVSHGSLRYHMRGSS